MESKILTFEEWIVKNKYKKCWQPYREPVDTGLLYGSLLDAIKYLKEVYQRDPELSISEHWTGYEDMEMVFEKHTEETDEEFKRRLTPFYEVYRALQKEEKKKKKDSEDEERKEYERLKKKFG